jgi:hypothetical protein
MSLAPSCSARRSRLSAALGVRVPRKLGRCGAGLARKLVAERVQRRSSKTEPRNQRTLDLDVEPAFDRARDELVGHHVDQQAGHEADQCEDGGQLDQQATAKLATTQTQGKPDHHPQDDPHQQAGDNHVQNKQAGVVSFVKLPVVGGLCQQEQQDQAHRDHRCSANDDAPAHCAGLVDPPRHPAERRRIHLPESGLSR